MKLLALNLGNELQQQFCQNFRNIFFTEYTSKWLLIVSGCSRHLEVLCKESVLRNFAKFKGKHLFQSLAVCFLTFGGERFLWIWRISSKSAKINVLKLVVAMGSFNVQLLSGSLHWKTVSSQVFYETLIWSVIFFQKRSFGNVL